MIRFARDMRLIPIVLLATICLFALKVSGLVLDGGYTLGEKLAERGRGGDKLRVTSGEGLDNGQVRIVREETPAPTKQSWAQEIFNFPDVTGSVGEQKSSASDIPLKVSEKPPSGETKVAVKTESGAMISIEPGRGQSPGERAVLERLQDRRQELDTRGRELEMRESLIKAAEKRLEGRVGELKNLESRVNTAVQKRDENEIARFKSIITMYESMKPKEAARIFDRLDMKVLVEVSNQINPRKMSEILAQMSPEAAERLTVELASRASEGGKPKSTDDLPKIDGRPAGQ